MLLEDQIENQKPCGGNFRQEPEGEKEGFAGSMKWFLQIHTLQTSSSSWFRASFETAFKDVAQRRPQGPDEAGLEGRS